MKITLLCSEPHHPVVSKLSIWAARQAVCHDVVMEVRGKDLAGGDLLFLVSCHEIIPEAVRKKYQRTLVIHASDLPKGRGWSPHVWAVLENQKRIVVTLLEAEDALDSGAIWAKTSFDLEGHELYDEINEKLFDAELELMTFAVENFDAVHPMRQESGETFYHRRRTPADSKIDIDKSIREQLALLRVSDPTRYPAFFEYHGHTYEIVLRKRTERA